MAEETITFRIDSDRRAALDAIATGTGRDRGEVLEEAVTACLEVHGRQIEHIREGLRQADAGEFATKEEVAAAFARWRE